MQAVSMQVLENFGGASRDRTDDLIVANDALSQLSYSPLMRRICFLILPVVSRFRLPTHGHTRSHRHAIESLGALNHQNIEHSTLKAEHFKTEAIIQP
jgi:hypothetical protein